ncbi:MAG: hypothetical protein ACYS32_11695, partial [Planctomycetota bacterium]
NKLRGALDKIDAFIQFIDGRINSPAVWPQQRLQTRDEYEAKRKLLLPKRRELEDRAKHIQYRLKEAPGREDAARLRAKLDEISKRIREIDFELSSPEWCVQKRKAEQSAAKQQYDSNLERAKAELKHRQSEWCAEMRAFEADVVTAKQRIIDAITKIENDRAMLAKMQKDIEIFTIENAADLDTDIVLYNQLKTMKANHDKLAEKIERDKKVLAKYQKELKAAEDRKNKYRKYKPPTGTEDEDIQRFIKEKEALEQMYDPWRTTTPQQNPRFRRRQQVQTTTPPSQQGQSQSPWQPPEQLQSRIMQLQDEIRRLRSEMTEMRKLMTDLVEHEKKRPKPSLFNIEKDPMDIGENPPEKPPGNVHKKPRVPKLKDYPLIGSVFEHGHKENSSIPRKKLPKKPLPEIHGNPLEPENIEPIPTENKHHEHPPDDIPNEPEEIETTEPIPPAD